MADNNKEQLHASIDGLLDAIIPCLGNRNNVAKMGTRRYDPEYNMRHSRRGLALLFGHTKFTVPGLDPRPETDKDIKDLARVLRGLEFDVRIYRDLKYEKLIREINAAARYSHEKNDCILVSIMTHGIYDYVYAADQSYKLDTIWSAFTADKCSSLAGKPKIFVVHASQGAAEKMEKTSRPIETDSDSTCSYRIPIYADFLIAFCTTPGHALYSNSVEGSWFIQSLCQELEANGRQYDMLQLLTFVAQRVALNFETYEERYKQMPCTMSTMTRILRFEKKRERSSF